MKNNIEMSQNQNTQQLIQISSTRLLSKESIDQNTNSEGSQELQSSTSVNEKKALKKQSRIKNKIIRKQMKLFEDKRKKIPSYFLQLISLNQIHRNFTTPKSFLVIGGIYIEIDKIEQIEYEDIPVLINVNNIVQSFKDGTVQINYGVQEITDNVDYVIQILQKTQNLTHYNLSLLLDKAKLPILSLKNQIEYLMNKYEPNKLNNIIQQRHNYMQAISQKAFKKFIKDDEFGQLSPWSIDWKSKSMMSYSCIVSKSMMALVGTDEDGLINYIMRKNINWIVNPKNRRKVVQKYMDYLIEDVNKNYSKEYIIEDFEIKTIDNLLIKCTCQIQIIKIEYPKELQFIGHNLDQVNNSDSLLINKLSLTNEHLESIVKIRQNNLLQIQNKQINEENTDYLTPENFEYYMNSQIFLEKFYSEYRVQGKQRMNQNSRCSYKFIDLEQN